MEGAGRRSGGTPMKAAVYSRYGPPDVVQIREVEKRVSKEDEVLIRVRKLRPIQLTGTGVWKKGTLSEKR